MHRLATIDVAMEGDVLVATIDRPGSELNAIDGQLHADLASFFAALKRERGARAAPDHRLYYRLLGGPQHPAGLEHGGRAALLSRGRAHPAIGFIRLDPRGWARTAAGTPATAARWRPRSPRRRPSPRQRGSD